MQKARELFFAGNSISTVIRLAGVNMASTSLNYPLLATFPNGVRLDYLQTQILMVGLMCYQIVDHGDELEFKFDHELNATEIAILEDVFLHYENPPQSPQRTMTNAPGPDAVLLKAYGDAGGVTIESKAGGMTQKTTGLGMFQHEQSVFRSVHGQFFSVGEGYLEDQDYVLPPTDIFLGLLIINPSAPRTLTLPDVDVLLESLWDPQPGDTAELYILNRSPTYAVSVAAGAGCTLYDPISVRPLGTTKLLVRIAANGLDENEPAAYTVYKVGMSENI